MSQFLHVQVSYNQGLVKTFLAPREMLAGDFADQAKKHGRFRSMRFREDVGADEAKALAISEGAIIMRSPNAT